MSEERKARGNNHILGVIWRAICFLGRAAAAGKTGELPGPLVTEEIRRKTLKTGKLKMVQFG
jgi:hypothetical protein